MFQLLWTGDVVADLRDVAPGCWPLAAEFALGILHFDLRFAERLLLYFPLTLYFLGYVRHHRRDARHVERVMWLCLTVFFCLYTLVTGAPHVGRYVVFLMPIVVLGAVRKAWTDWQSGDSRRRRAASAAAVLFLITNVAELAYRYKSYAHDLLAEAMLAPERRRATTDRLLADLDRPAHLPVVLALESIQVRYALDDRFVIRSIDGRTDRGLFTKSRNGVVDFPSYVRDMDIGYFFLWPSAEKNPWLAQLTGIEAGPFVDYDGVRVRRLSSGAFEVARAPR